MRKIFIYLIIFIISSIIGYNIAFYFKNNEHDEYESSKIENSVETKANLEEKISPNAKFGLKQHYKKCRT